jgi:hypothetical protein
MIFFLLYLLVTGVPAQVDRPLHYPLENPILHAFSSGDFTEFATICKPKVSVNLSRPFEIKGYIPVEKFIDEITAQYRYFQTESIEWYERQIDVDNQITTQSLKVKLRPSGSKLTLSYQIIFMLEKKDKKWKIFYLRSIED